MAPAGHILRVLLEMVTPDWGVLATGFIFGALAGVLLPPPPSPPHFFERKKHRNRNGLASAENSTLSAAHLGVQRTVSLSLTLRTAHCYPALMADAFTLRASAHLRLLPPLTQLEC